MVKSICLVTYELAPVNRGGAGVVNDALVRYLAQAGNQVHVIADMPANELEQYRSFLARVGIQGVTVYGLVDFSPPIPRASTLFQSKSIAFRTALYALARRTPLDLVEFFDYAGPAYETLTLRHEDDELANTTVAARIHGTLGMIGHAEGLVDISLERHTMHRMEEWALRLADLVFAPLPGVAQWYTDMYGLDATPVRECPPPMELLLEGVGQPLPRDDWPRDVLFYGKLWPVKGCEEFVDAAVHVAGEAPHLRFIIIGRDSNLGPHGTSMQKHLETRIPPALRERFQFVPHIDRSELAAMASAAVCAVIPSRAESFCLAAHELHRVGCPLVLSDIHAFRSVFPDRERCLKSDGTAGDLAACIERIATDAGLQKRLAGSGRSMTYLDVLAGYADLPTPTFDNHRAAFARWQIESLGNAAADEKHNSVTKQPNGGSLRLLSHTRTWLGKVLGHNTPNEAGRSEASSDDRAAT